MPGFKTETSNDGKTTCTDLNNSSCITWDNDVCVQCGAGEVQSDDDES